MPKHPYIRSSKFAWLLLFSHHLNWFECVCIYNLQTLLVILRSFFFIFGIRKFVERGIMWSELSVSLFACVCVCVCVHNNWMTIHIGPKYKLCYFSHLTFETSIFFLPYFMVVTSISLVLSYVGFILCNVFIASQNVDFPLFFEHRTSHLVVAIVYIIFCLCSLILLFSGLFFPFFFAVFAVFSASAFHYKPSLSKREFIKRSLALTRKINILWV